MVSSVEEQLVSEGYKKTELGTIPEEWLIKTARDIFIKIQDGTHFSPKIGGNDYLYVTSKNIRPGKLDLSSAEYIDEKQHKSIYKRCDVRKGDILLTKDGANTGNAALNNINDEFSLLSSVAFLRVSKEIYSSQYFLQQIMSPSFQQAVQVAMSGNAITRLTLDKINKLEFLVPSTKEQTAIATALSDVDALITSLEKLIAKKRAIKTAAMQQLLTGKKRLPGFEEDWKTVSMNRDADLKARIGWQALTTTEYLDQGDFYLVTGTDFKGGRVNWSTCHYVDEWRYSQDRNIQLTNGDVLLTKDGTIGKVGYVDKLNGPATLNSGVFVIRPVQNAFNPMYLFYILSSRIFDDFLNRITAGSTITHLYQKDFVTFEFEAPNLEEQNQIAAVFSSMDDELDKLDQRLIKTQNLKQGMMQELLTGRTRLV
ncbi:type I restriction enzyme, S subunit [Amphritea japonica ATCC BAA-1530]|uniref:Type I restriction enzyme, S subunit n=1 Tax=Amphritea japonica ATCC BAA-1530 TaxID=1278309 RepID=A0A7R6PHV7_9GAMM|nr:type I restriction enzyme, S subunit [Amphritea japonica ATCC BAA-1530]